MEKTDNANVIVKTTALTMHVVESYVSRGDFVIDCTMGNGHDTLSLAKMVGICDPEPAGYLMAFDVQEAALMATSDLLKENGADTGSGRVQLIQASHSRLSEYRGRFPGEGSKAPSVIVFNLGYMPGQDKKVLTEKNTTLEAVAQAIELVAVNGVVAVTCYSGHTEGAEETQALRAMLAGLSSKVYHVAYVDMINQKKTAPSVFFITRKK